MVCFKRIDGKNDVFVQCVQGDGKWDIISLTTPLSGTTFKDDDGNIYDNNDGGK